MLSLKAEIMQNSQLTQKKYNFKKMTISCDLTLYRIKIKEQLKENAGSDVYPLKKEQNNNFYLKHLFSASFYLKILTLTLGSEGIML